MAQERLERLFANAAIILRCSPREDFAEFDEIHLPSDVPTIDVLTKCDSVVDSADRISGVLETSARFDVGIDSLARAVASKLRVDFGMDEPGSPGTARRQEALREAAQALGTALETLDVDQTLVAASIRSALDWLGQITGEVHTEDLLDRIFSRFCVGK
ncbi:MAG: hypothetical protein HUK22_01525 [Thermoguttaceae bacterium]|nr:hypothetical protein [Thermoguttaceae bacterium]